MGDFFNIALNGAISVLLVVTIVYAVIFEPEAAAAAVQSVGTRGDLGPPGWRLADGLGDGQRAAGFD